MSLLWLLAIPVWIFLCVAVIHCTGIFAIDCHFGEWWSLPLFVAVMFSLLPTLVYGVCVLIGFAVGSPFPGTEHWL